jgi:cbb3-type cytochrome oxidase maturation protein
MERPSTESSGAGPEGREQPGMELTWIAIISSLLMGGGALLILLWAVRSKQFRNFEDVKYQVFWLDAEEPFVRRPQAKESEEQGHGSSTQRD